MNKGNFYHENNYQDLKVQPSEKRSRKTAFTTDSEKAPVISSEISTVSVHQCYL